MYYHHSCVLPYVSSFLKPRFWHFLYVLAPLCLVVFVPRFWHFLYVFWIAPMSRRLCTSFLAFSICLLHLFFGFSVISPCPHFWPYVCSIYHISKNYKPREIHSTAGKYKGNTKYPSGGYYCTLLYCTARRGLYYHLAILYIIYAPVGKNPSTVPLYIRSSSYSTVLYPSRS